MKEEPEDVLSVKEAAACAGVSRHTIRRLLMQGLLQGVAQAGKYGKEYRIYRDSLQKWMEGKPVHAPGHAPAAPGADPAQASAGTRLHRVPAPGHAPAPHVILERYEQAVHRVGWLEGQLEMTRRMLTEGQEAITPERRAEASLLADSRFGPERRGARGGAT
jgi:excisionase family DNA binding protein